MFHLIAPPRTVGAKGDHLQLTISDYTGAVRCIGFGMGKLAKKLQEVETFNIAYEAQINHYNGNSSPQLCLTDIQFPESPKTSSRSSIVEVGTAVKILARGSHAVKVKIDLLFYRNSGRVSNILSGV